MSRLADRAVLVTGAGSGIGRAAVWELVRDGASVLALDIDEQGVTQTAAAAPDGVPVVTCVGDAASEAVITGAVELAEQRFGHLDGLFANAGISGGPVSLLEATAQLWLDVLRTNVISAALAIRVAAPRMRSGASIVLTSSVAGLRANAGGAPYSASKAALVSLTQTAAVALAGSGIRVNAVCPGLVETAMTAGLFALADERGTRDRIGRLNPLGRHAQPREIATVVAFLLSDESSYINGQAIPVDGGLSASHPFTRPRR